ARIDERERARPSGDERGGDLRFGRRDRKLESGRVRADCRGKPQILLDDVVALADLRLLCVERRRRALTKRTAIESQDAPGAGQARERRRLQEALEVQ